MSFQLHGNGLNFKFVLLLKQLCRIILVKFIFVKLLYVFYANLTSCFESMRYTTCVVFAESMRVCGTQHVSYLPRVWEYAAHNMYRICREYESMRYTTCVVFAESMRVCGTQHVPYLPRVWEYAVHNMCRICRDYESMRYTTCVVFA